MAISNRRTIYFAGNILFALLIVILVQYIKLDWHFVLFLMTPVIFSLFFFEKREYLVSLIIFGITDGTLAYVNQGLNKNSIYSILFRIIVLLVAGEMVTYQKKKNKITIDALRNSEKKFRNLLNYSYDWEYFITSEGKIDYSSPSCFYQTQYRAEEFIENPGLLLEIVAEEDLEAVKKHYEGELTGEQQKPIQFKIYKKNGDYRIIRHTCSPVEENGKFIGVRVSNRNATDRWNTEQSLRESEKQYRYIFENLVDVYYRTSLDGKIENVSPSVEKISGYTVKELIGMNASVLYADPEGRQRFLELIMKQGELRNFETQFKDKNGDIKILSFNNRLIYENGKPVGIEGVFRDVTEYHRIKEELEKEKKKFQDLFDLNLAALYITGLDGKIIEANLAAAKLFGFSTIDELKEYNAVDLYADGKEKREDYLRELMKNKSVTSKEFKFRRKDGTVFWALESSKLMDDERIMGTLIDVTELKLTLDRLSESERQLKESNSTKNRFMNIIAHDLRAPFMSILGLSEILTNEFDELTDSERKELLDGLRSGIENTYKFTESLLEWARIQTDRIEFEPMELGLRDVVLSVIYFNRIKAESKGVELIESIPDNIKIFTDENMLNTVLRNLITNALKFTPRGGKIEIIARELNEKVEVCVSDTGIGMDEEIASKLFSLSDKITTKGTEGEKGSGLGLIIVHDMIVKMGGEIWVESEPEKGSKFYFTIPALKNSVN